MSLTQTVSLLDKQISEKRDELAKLEQARDLLSGKDGSIRVTAKPKAMTRAMQSALDELREDPEAVVTPQMLGRLRNGGYIASEGNGWKVLGPERPPSDQ